MIVTKELSASIRNATGQRSPTFTVTFLWDTDDPLAITLKFPPGVGASQNGQEWQFGRDLLHRGCYFARTGDLDVVIWPEVDKVVISLRPPHGRADLVVSRSDVRAFVEATVAVQPMGKEDLGNELDLWLAMLPDGDE